MTPDYSTVLREQNRILEQQCAELGGLKSQLHQITEVINALAAAGTKNGRRAAPRPLSAGPFGPAEEVRQVVVHSFCLTCGPSLRDGSTAEEHQAWAPAHCKSNPGHEVKVWFRSAKSGDQ